jgi:hypothetical protein
MPEMGRDGNVENRRPIFSGLHLVPPIPRVDGQQISQIILELQLWWGMF